MQPPLEFLVQTHLEHQGQQNHSLVLLSHHLVHLLGQVGLLEHQELKGHLLMASQNQLGKQMQPPLEYLVKTHLEHQGQQNHQLVELAHHLGYHLGQVEELEHQELK
ncbi:uncharacterized protein ACDL77_007502 isoform 1-T1 [Rhynchocyon petersi]